MPVDEPASQNGTDELNIHGRVTDKRREGLAGAGVSLIGRSVCFSICDSEGYFDLTIPHPKKDDSIAVSFIGYNLHKMALSDWKENSSIVLEDNAFSLHSIVVDANPDFSESFCQERLEKLDIYLSPIAAGDPLNALQALPSLSGISESANPEFRGSEAWASKVILNGIAIEQPVRNTQLNGLGNFSLFNTELIDHLCVYPGPAPLSLTNSTSGAVDIHTVDGLESPQRQVSLSAAEFGFLIGQPWEHGLVQIYGNSQISPLYTRMNHTEDRLKSFSSHDMGVHGCFVKGNSQFKFFRYVISEKYEGVQTQLNHSTSCQAHQERQFGVFNYRYRRQNWQMEADAGEDGSYSRHTQEEDSYSLQKQQMDVQWKLKHWATEQFWWQAGLSYKNARCQGDWDTQDSLIQFQQADAFLSARWQSRNGISLAVSGRAHPKHLSSFPARQSAQIVFHFPIGLHHHWQFSAGSNHSHAGPWFGRMEFCELQSGQASMDYRYESSDLKGCLNAYIKCENGPVAMDYDLAVLNAERRTMGLEVRISKEYEGFKMELSGSHIQNRLRFAERTDSKNSLKITGDETVNPEKQIRIAVDDRREAKEVLHFYGIKAGQDYRASNDLPYLIKACLQYTSPQHFCIALSGTARSGTCFTPVKGGSYSEESHVILPVFAEYHSKRLPAYRRFDLSLNKVIFREDSRMTVLFATFSNVFNRANPVQKLYSSDFKRLLGEAQAEPYSLYFGMRWSW